MKLPAHQDCLNTTINEVRLCEMLRANRLPAPETLFVDAEGVYPGRPFLIQSNLEGYRLSQWLTMADREELTGLFSCIGETYKRIHSIKGLKSGVWDGGSEKTLPISPNDFYFNTEILSDSGKAAFESGIITKSEYVKIQSIWEANLPALKNHQTALVHGSPFPWTICLLKGEDGNFKVTRLNALGDFLWWDPAYDLPFLLYPPGYEWSTDWQRSFIAAYGLLPEDWRINLYAILQHLCALNDIYLAPPDSPGPRIPNEAVILRMKKLLALF